MMNSWITLMKTRIDKSFQCFSRLGKGGLAIAKILPRKGVRL